MGVNNLSASPHANYLTSNTGSNNTLIGGQSGSSYVNAESSNIMLGANIPGTANENNTLRIGYGTGTSSSQLNQVFVAGIYNINPGAGTVYEVGITSADQIVSIPAASTWTPSLKFGGASSGMTYTTQSGYYRTFGGAGTGALAFITLEVVLSNKGSSSGTATIALPTGNAAIDQSFSIYGSNFGGSFHSLTSRVSSGGATLTLGGFTRGIIDGDTTDLTNSDFSNTSSFVITGTYVLS